MAALVNKTIEVKGRNWVVLGYEGRQFKTVIAFEEIPTVTGGAL